MRPVSCLENCSKNKHKLYILKGHVPEQPFPTSRSNHDAWWKQHYDAIDVIPNL